MFKQSSLITDYIFPLIKAKKDPNTGNFVYEELIGTAFFIGNRGFALTAGHVIDQLLENHNPEKDAIIAIFNTHPSWTVFEIRSFEKHPTQDVGLIKVDGTNWKSIITITDKPQHSACEYHCWGYPHEIAKEYQKLEENSDERPDIIFTQGYVRRRITGDLYPTMIFKGTAFYELSETVGGGNSGGPVILKKTTEQLKWHCFGIYIGEKEGGNISYAIRADSFFDWRPEILGNSVGIESK